MAGAARPGSLSHSQRWDEVLVLWRPRGGVCAGWVGPPCCSEGSQGSSVEAPVLKSRLWLSMSLLSRVTVGGKETQPAPQEPEGALGPGLRYSLSGNPLASVFRISSRSTSMVPATALSPDGYRFSYGLSASTLTPYSLSLTQQPEWGFYSVNQMPRGSSMETPQQLPTHSVKTTVLQGPPQPPMLWPCCCHPHPYHCPPFSRSSHTGLLAGSQTHQVRSHLRAFAPAAPSARSTFPRWLTLSPPPNLCSTVTCALRTSDYPFKNCRLPRLFLSTHSPAPCLSIALITSNILHLCFFVCFCLSLPPQGLGPGILSPASAPCLAQSRGLITLFE